MSKLPFVREADLVQELAPLAVGANAWPDGVVLDAPAGRFDAHEAPGFRLLFESVVEAGARAVTVDLRKVVFMDSTALAELVRNQRLLQGVGGSLYLANPSDAVRVILDVTGLAAVFALTRSA